MKIFVANLGSTSFKYRLYEMAEEKQLARGGVERIGEAQSSCFVEIGTERRELVAAAPDHAAAVRLCLEQLTDPEIGCLDQAGEVSAIGFKAVHGGRASGVARVDNEVLQAMDEVGMVAPAHNPPYLAAMRLLHERLPEIPLVAAFETGFHQTIPERLRHYAVPWEWAENHLVRRWGFHGASHRYVSNRAIELLGREDAKVVSCHLGGSSSVCATRGGKSVATSMGMSPQSGLPQNNRCGDFDPFALPLVMQQTGKSLEEVLHALAEQSGLLGLSGKSGDVRDLAAAAEQGHTRSQLALDVFVTSVRHSIGAYLVELGGADAIVFTGGIGENRPEIRASVCANLASLGIEIDHALNVQTHDESRISTPRSHTEVWVIPTNEELVVARQVRDLLQEEGTTVN